MVKKFKRRLKGERIILQINKYDIKLAQKIFKTIDENKEYLSKWLPWAPSTKRIEDTLQFLQDTEEGIKKGTKVNYGIYLGKDYIGNIGVFDIDANNKSAEIGYWLSEKFGRCGYVTEAVKIIEKEFFNNLDFNRLQIKCDAINIPSAKVAEKCDYKLEGILREDSFVKDENRFRDTKIYSKLKSEFS